MSDKIKTLLTLLEDENRNVASQAMAELLRHEEELPQYLNSLQESENLILRKRAHQMQSILSIRRRRKNFAMNLKSNTMGLIEGLTELHLQWYDYDAEETISKQWNAPLGGV